MSKLFLVPTPIGNLKDITLRGLEVLQHADLILAEDTRTSGKLMKHFQINTPLQSHHMHNEHSTLPKIITQLKQGSTIALITDAGTPAISDPGFLLVRQAIEEGILVECLPGATAFVPALVQSGLPNDRFIFEAFLPPKKGRKTRLEKIAQEERTVLLYESPHKLLKTLSQLSEYCGKDRKIAIVRELTKMHEETFRGTLEKAIVYFEQKPPKGEFVLCLSGKVTK